ncbi:MAG: hypothetical protein HY738_11460 [Bacteroidia bacterium]|nr:hypothetical protein [Bacteroidia bacterium]
MEIVVEIFDKKAVSQIVDTIRPIYGVKQLWYKETKNGKPKRLSTDSETIMALFCTSSAAFAKHLENEPSDIF